MSQISPEYVNGLELHIRELKTELIKTNKGTQRNAHINRSLVKQLGAAETKLEAMKDIEHGWDKCNYDEQECLARILKVLHHKE